MFHIEIIGDFFLRFAVVLAQFFYSHDFIKIIWNHNMRYWHLSQFAIIYVLEGKAMKKSTVKTANTLTDNAKVLNR